MIFIGGGGRTIDFGYLYIISMAPTHITSAEPNSLSAGVQGPIKGPGRSGVVLMISRAI